MVRKALARDPAARYADARRMSEELGDCGIQNSWIVIDDPSSLETWQAQTPDGLYELRMVARPRISTVEVVVRLDRGAGLRQVIRQQHPSEGRARQARRTLLVRVVEGTRLR